MTFKGSRGKCVTKIVPKKNHLMNAEFRFALLSFFSFTFLWCQPHSHHHVNQRNVKFKEGIHDQIKCIFHSNFRVFFTCEVFLFLFFESLYNMILLDTVESYDSSTMMIPELIFVSEKLNLFLFTFVLMDNLQNHLSFE